MFLITSTLLLWLVPQKYQGRKKKVNENDFPMFGLIMDNAKENQI